MKKYSSTYHIESENGFFFLGQTLIVTTIDESVIVGRLSTLGPAGIYLYITGNKNAKFVNYNKIAIIEKR